MNKRWSADDDKFLAAFVGVGTDLIAGDLGRSEKAVLKRIAWLKSIGAWDDLLAAVEAWDRYAEKLMDAREP